MAKMSFEEFQASKLWYDDLARLPHWQYDDDEAHPGYGYEGGLYIDKLTSGEHAGMFDLVIGNQEWVDDDLPMLERLLYQFAISEGICEVRLTADEASRVRALAADARATSEDDWGSERQLAAENAFTTACEPWLGEEWGWALKATTDEMIAEALRILGVEE